MAIVPGVWGIDLGQCALKALRVENIEGQVTATAFDYVEHPKILSQPDADPDQLTREALEKFLSRNSLRGDTVVISIPGQSGLARFVKLPPVEERKIGDIVRFEAKQQIPFNLDEVVWDYQKIGSGVVTDGFAMETEIGLFAIKRDTVNRYLQHFKDVAVEVNTVQMGPLALCNFLAYDLIQSPGENADEPGKKLCLVALDIGTDNSNLVITDGGRIIWQRPIPLGGNHFTRALTKDMKLTFAKAEHLKRNATKSPELKQILASLKPVLNDFVGEVQRSLGYFTNTHRDASVQYMVGLGSAFRLPGLQKFLSEKLQLDVRRLQKLQRLSGEDVVNTPVFGENVLSFAVAYGLALQGLGVGKLHTNLLPQDIRVERMIRAKKPWAVTAAAAMLLGTSALGMGYAMQYRGVASKPVITAMDQGKSVKSTVDKFDSKVKEIQGKIEEDKKAVKSIVIGQEERFNWLRFMQFLNDTLPKPDASNLSDEAKKLYWTDTPKARMAYQSFLAQETGTGKPSLLKDEEQWRDFLIQCNVEGVYCIFCPNLAGYVKGLLDDKSWDKRLGFTMDPKHRATPPAEDAKGWVVELRGYTYNQVGLDFVNKAIVQNINRIGAGKVTAQAGETPPGDQPPTAGSAPAPAPKPESTEPGEKAKEDDKEPVLGRVSHAVLYNYFTDPNPTPDSFHLINSHVVDQLVTTASTASTQGKGGDAEGGGGAPPGIAEMMKRGGPMGGRAGGVGGSGWTPLTKGGGGGGPAGGGMGLGGKNIGPMMNAIGAAKRGARMEGGPEFGPGGPRFGAGRSGGMPMAMGGVAQPGGDGSLPNEESKAKKGRHTRTEFIILFIWKEPTPSDLLLPSDEATDTQS
jgi:type IV pilus assembly protein PilM